MRFIRSINEFKQNNLIESKMSELKDIISNISDQEILYEWETKFDHQLFITFSYKKDYFKYELDINDLFLKKYNNDNLIYDKTLSSLEDGLDIIYNEVLKLLENIDEQKR
jgi:hypothetical protein